MAGFATRHGVHDQSARQRIAEIIQRIEADGIRTVRIGFADQHGVMRGKSFAANQIATLFEDGMTAPSSLLLKDLAHRTVLPVWSNEATGLSGMAGIGDIDKPAASITMFPGPVSEHEVRFNSILIPF